MRKSESIKELAAALAKAQGEMTGAKRDADNPYFKSKYADLESVIEAMKGPFSKNGLSVTQEFTGEFYLSATLMHSSGEWLEYEPLKIPVKDAMNAQAVKSSFTLLRRAQLLAIAGIPEADDDGNAAASADHRPITNKTNQINKANSDSVKNEALVSQYEIKQLFDLTNKKGIALSRIKELLKVAYNLEDTKGLKHYQLAELMKVISTKSVEEAFLHYAKEPPSN